MEGSKETELGIGICGRKLKLEKSDTRIGMEDRVDAIRLMNKLSFPSFIFLLQPNSD